MTLFELARDHLAFGEYVADHHLRLRKDDARQFINAETPLKSDELDKAGFFGDTDQLLGIRVVYDESVSDNEWRMCSNSNLESVIESGTVV